MRRIGRLMSYTTHQINRALDACISAQVSPELTGMRGMMLGYIVRTTREGRPVYQRDLEIRFRVRRSSVTTMLKAMEQAGFITRTSVEQDARLKSLTATDKGLACYDQVESCINAFEAELQQGISAADLARLESTLDCMRANASRAQDAAAP